MAAPYRFRLLTPDQVPPLVAARRAGAKVRDLAAAYGVSVRTVYRYLHSAALEGYTVRVGDWWATFVIEVDGPVRCSPWYATESEEAAANA